MKQLNKTLKVETVGQGFYEISKKLNEIVEKFKLKNGLLTIYILHTSCSLLIQENADKTVQEDLLNFFNKIAPENNNYLHNYEVPDDMPEHIKSALTQTNLSIPIENFQMTLGTWQGIYLFEHRKSNHTRTIKLHLIG